MEILDVLIVGAGLSGIGAAWHIQQRLPGKSYAILEGRGAIGGTWDLFRYPGIRSDSDMYTLGYRFKPWRNAKAIADGESIRHYVEETARENGIDQHIRFHHHVTAAAWSSEDACWTLSVDTPEGPQKIGARFLYLCTGYYRYDRGYTPDFPGSERFGGTWIHPQLWPEDFKPEGKTIVVIGSGATAVTLIPELAQSAKHVTMLQRSPTYMVSRPASDKLALTLRRFLPEGVAYAITRWKNVSMQQIFFTLARKRPAAMRRRLTQALADLMPGRADLLPHFQPHYNPWDQRLCLVPDADLFDALTRGKAEVVTDTIANFDETGILLASGRHLDADTIVTATGLDLQLLGGASISVDGRTIAPGDLVYYKGLMFQGVPNLVNVFGYTNASWTLKADLTAEYVCRLIAEADRRGAAIACPVSDAPMEHIPFVDFSSGYVTRAASRLPRQGAKRPWRLYQNYLFDLLTLRYGRIDDGAMRFSRRRAPRVDWAA